MNSNSLDELRKEHINYLLEYATKNSEVIYNFSDTLQNILYCFKKKNIQISIDDTLELSSLCLEWKIFVKYCLSIFHIPTKRMIKFESFSLPLLNVRRGRNSVYFEICYNILKLVSKWQRKMYSHIFEKTTIYIKRLTTSLKNQVEKLYCTKKIKGYDQTNSCDAFDFEVQFFFKKNKIIFSGPLNFAFDLNIYLERSGCLERRSSHDRYLKEPPTNKYGYFIPEIWDNFDNFFAKIIFLFEELNVSKSAMEVAWEIEKLTDFHFWNNTCYDFSFREGEDIRADFGNPREPINRPVILTSVLGEKRELD